MVDHNPQPPIKPKKGLRTVCKMTKSTFSVERTEGNDRKEFFYTCRDAGTYEFNTDFMLVVDATNEDPIEKEILRQDELVIGRTNLKLRDDFQLLNYHPNQVVERVRQILKDQQKMANAKGFLLSEKDVETFVGYAQIGSAAYAVYFKHTIENAIHQWCVYANKTGIGGLIWRPRTRILSPRVVKLIEMPELFPVSEEEEED